MESQRDLLQSTPWNVLIILDACRADIYKSFVPSALEVRVMTYKGCAATGHWMTRFNRFFNVPLLYIAANPACSKLLEPWGVAPADPELSKLEHSYSVLALWKTMTGKYCPDGKQTVHPRSVYEALDHYLNEYGQPERMVVHMAQPHTPYIGRFRGDHQKKWRMSNIYRAVRRGEIAVEDCRRAYTSNMRLAIEWAYKIVQRLKGSIVITADHGELIGDGGHFGHSHQPLLPGLVMVPWDAHLMGKFEPAEPPQLPMDKDSTIKEKLNALGYC